MGSLMGNILGKTIVVFTLTIIGLGLKAQDLSRELVREGNELYASGNYEEAEKKYVEAGSLDAELSQALFNKADALYKKGDFENAAKIFTDVAASASDKSTQASAFHNLGNTLMKTENYQGSVNAYKEALRRNPADEDTRYNLSYALQKLREQQQQQQENQENQDQNQDQQEKQENQDGKGDKDENQDEEKQQQDNGKNKGDENDPNKLEGDKPEYGDDQREQQSPSKMSKEDAERLLKALQNNERNTQEKVNAKRVRVSGKTIEKDW